MDIFEQLKDMGLETSAPGTEPQIWRFRLEKAVDAGVFEVEMPKGATITTAMPSSTGSINVWALVDPLAEKVNRRFAVTLSGKPISYKIVAFVQTLMVETTSGVVAIHVLEVE